jgi:hypothetical protein
MAFNSPYCTWCSEEHNMGSRYQIAGAWFCCQDCQDAWLADFNLHGFFAERDASEPGSKEEEQAVEKIMDSIFGIQKVKHETF